MSWEKASRQKSKRVGSLTFIRSVLMCAHHRSCNFQMKDPTAWFDADKPDGLFQLDFEDAYDRSVMEDLIHMATSNDAILIQKVKYTLGKDSRNLQLEVASEDYLESSVKTHLINDKDLKELFTR